MKGFIEVHDRDNNRILVNINQIIDIIEWCVGNCRKVLLNTTISISNQGNSYTVIESYDEIKQLIEMSTK